MSKESDLEDSIHFLLHFTEDGSDEIPRRIIGKRGYEKALPIALDLLKQVYEQNIKLKRKLSRGKKEENQGGK